MKHDLSEKLTVRGESSSDAVITLLIFYSLAVYRMAILISEDSGPFHAISRFRSWLRREEKKSPALKKSDIAAGVSCLRCSSLQLAIPVAAYACLHRRLADWLVAIGDVFLTAMALSAVAIILSRAFPAK